MPTASSKTSCNFKRGKPALFQRRNRRSRLAALVAGGADEVFDVVVMSRCNIASASSFSRSSPLPSRMYPVEKCHCVVGHRIGLRSVKLQQRDYNRRGRGGRPRRWAGGAPQLAEPLMRLKQICNHLSQWLGDQGWQEEDSGK